MAPSLLLRKPVMLAWSTPGACVLASVGMVGGFSMAEAVGDSPVCAALVTLAGDDGARNPGVVTLGWPVP